MQKNIQILAPAKVNIGLEVYPKREDGFHNICSIFQTVRLFDRLSVSLLQNENSCILHSGNFFLPKENTITKTYDAFCKITGCRTGVKVTLEKHIPSGGGLGGGSSDAASFLRALAQLNNIELSETLKNSVASLVGSDVFFFLTEKLPGSESVCGIVTGRGEHIRQFSPRNDLHFLLLFPDVHSSTKEAYELLDKYSGICSPATCPDLSDLIALYESPVQNWTFKNSFTSVLVQKYPAVGKALQDIKNSGALWAEMSGSGAVVFGVFTNLKDAQTALARLKQSWNYCVIA